MDSKNPFIDELCTNGIHTRPPHKTHKRSFINFHYHFERYRSTHLCMNEMICERNWGFVFIVLSRPQCQWMNAMNDWMCIGNCDCCDGSGDECEHNLSILIKSTYILRQFVLHCVVRDAMHRLSISQSIEFVAFWYYLCTSCFTWPLSIAHCYTYRAHTQHTITHWRRCRYDVAIIFNYIYPYKDMNFWCFFC